jgi:hypothetical protein
MYFIVTAILVAGAFVIVGTATATPLSPWLSHIGTAPRADLGLSPCADTKSPRDAR